MLRLALSSIRVRIASFGGALIAIVFAAGLVVACGVMLESAIRSDIGGTTRYEAASAVIVRQPLLEIPPEIELEEEPDHPSPESPPIPASVVEELGDLAGVLQAIGDSRFPAQVVDQEGRPLVNESGGPSVGRDWASAELTPFTLQDGGAPEHADSVVLDADQASRGGYQPGDQVPVITPDGVLTFTVSGIAAPPDRDGLEEQSTVFFSSETARDLDPFPDSFQTVGVLGDPEASLDDLETQLAAVLDEDEYRILTGDRKQDAEEFAHQVLPQTTIEFLGTASGLTGFVTIFIVASTFSFSIQQRTREIGLLRAVAATPRQVTQLIVREAVLVALLGSAIGSIVGLLLVHPLRWMLIEVRITPSELEVVYGPVPIIVATLSSLIITQIAVFFSARRAARIEPSSALREAAIEPGRIGWVRLFFGIVFAIGGVGSYYVMMQVGGEAGAALSVVLVMVLCLAGGLLGPVLVWPFGWVIGRLLMLRGGTTAMLARASVLSNRRRVAAVSIPLMLTACFATLFLFIGSVQEYGVVRDTENRLTADYVVVSGASEGLPLSAIPAIQDLPDVTTATGTLANIAIMNVTPIGGDYSDLTEVPVRGVEIETLMEVLDLGVTDGRIDDLSSSQVAISDFVARGRRAEVGDTLTLWLPDGTRLTPEVIAIYQHSMGFGDILLPREFLAEHTTGQLISEVFVSTAPDADDANLQDAVGALQSEIPTLEAVDRQTYTDILGEQIRENTRVTYLLAGLAVIYTAISIANTLMMSVSERTREFARMRMIGATREQVLSMILWETIIVVTLGVSLGLGISLLANAGFSAGLFGESMLVIPWLSFIAVVVGVILLGLISSVIPAWLASRSTPHAAMGGHE